MSPRVVGIRRYSSLRQCRQGNITREAFSAMPQEGQGRGLECTRGPRGVGHRRTALCLCLVAVLAGLGHHSSVASAVSSPVGGIQSAHRAVIATNVRQEDEFVVEWLNYHLWIGFDHIFVFCQDDSPEALQALLQPYINANCVTILPWTVGDQQGALRYHLENHQDPNMTVFFTDVDEFLVLCEHATVGDFLADHLGSSTGPSCLHFPWFNFGTSYLEAHPEGGSVLVHYHIRAGGPGQKGNWQYLGKVALTGEMRLRAGAQGGQMHHSCDEYDYSPQTPSGASGAGGQLGGVPVSSARLYHYWLRGGLTEALQRRLARGSAGDWFYQVMYDKYTVEQLDLNLVSDPTMASILEEFPGLMAPEPPSSRRGEERLPGGFCKDPVDLDRAEL